MTDIIMPTNVALNPTVTPAPVVEDVVVTDDTIEDVVDGELVEEEEEVKSKFHDLFPKPLVVATTTYAFQVLLYMQRRPELGLDQVGLTALPFFQNVRHVQDKFIKTYYQYLAGMVRPLLRYATLEESCSMSGAYDADRLKTVEAVRQALLRFDNPDDPRVYGYLTSMLELPPSV